MKTNLLQKNIPREWVVKKMDDFIKEGSITLGRGDVISKDDIKNFPGENPIYSSSIKNNALFGTYAKHMFDEELITWSVDGGGDFFHRPKHKFSITNVSGYMKADQKQFDYKFLAYYLQEEHSKKSFDYQNKAHPSVIRELYEIAKPPLVEQQKIAEILGVVDEDIAKTQEVIEATEKLKRGLMQQLFARGIGHTKFKETKIGQIPEEWGIVYLGDVTDFIDYRGKTPQKTESGIPLITAKNVRQGYISSEPQEYIAESDYKGWMTRGIPKIGDVLFTTEAPLGYVAQIDTEQKIALAQRIITIQSDVLDHTYLKYMLMSPVIYGEIQALGTGGTVKGIKASTLRKLEIFKPSKKEQKEIAEILSAVDEKISVNKKLKAKLTLLKKGLMQDLLSGKVRTI